MKRTIQFAVFALVLSLVATTARAQNKFTAPFSGIATGGAYTWTNQTGMRLGLSAVNLTGATNVLAGGLCTIKLVQLGQTNWLASTATVTNSLNYLDGECSLSLEQLGEVRFVWPTTNSAQWSVLLKN